MTPVAWFGPVMDRDVRASVPAPRELRVFGCVGDRQGKHPNCADEAAKWKDAQGRRLPRLLERAKLPAGSTPFLAAYSAGGMAVRRLLLNPRDARDVAGVCLFDATYGERGPDGEVRIDALQEALVLFALDCIDDGRPLVILASSSIPGGGGPSGTEVLAALRNEIVRRDQVLFDAFGDPLLAGLRTPATVCRFRNVWLVNFDSAYTHAEHVRTLPSIVLPRVLALLGS